MVLKRPPGGGLVHLILGALKPTYRPGEKALYCTLNERSRNRPATPPSHRRNHRSPDQEPGRERAETAQSARAVNAPERCIKLRSTKGYTRACHDHGSKPSDRPTRRAGSDEPKRQNGALARRDRTSSTTTPATRACGSQSSHAPRSETPRTHRPNRPSHAGEGHIGDHRDRGATSTRQKRHTRLASAKQHAVLNRATPPAGKRHGRIEQLNRAMQPKKTSAIIQSKAPRLTG